MSVFLRTSAWILCGLGILSTVALAAETAPAPPRDGAAAPEEDAVTWPSPWMKAGTRLVYDVVTVNEKNRATGNTVLTTRSVQTLTPDVAASGKNQAWTESAIRFEFSDGIPVEQRALMTGLAGTFEGRPAVIQLNDEGNATGLANTAELMPMYQDALRKIGEEAVRAGVAAVADPGKRAETEKTLRENMARVMASMGTEPMLVASVLKTPAAYNFPGRGGMVAGETYAYEEQVANPFGGEPFPMIGEFVLTMPAAGAQELELRWELRMHPTKAAPILWALVEKMTGQALAPEVRKGLPDSIDFSYLTRYRIRRDTGVVTWMQRTEARKVTGVADRTVTTMTLREGG